MSVMANADINRAVVPETASVADDKPDRPTIVEIKNSKLVFRQKPLLFEKMSETMQEIVKFREILEQRIESNAAPLAVIPDEHRPLIAKLVHESDKGLQALSKHIQQELLPAQDEDDEEACAKASTALSVDVIEKAVKSVATRTNYGLDPIHAANGRIPAAWQIWRWEVKEEHRDWLPKATYEKALTRLAEREQAKRDVQTLFLALPEAERTAVVGSKPAANGKAAKDAKEVPKAAHSSSTTPSITAEDPSTPSKHKKKAEAENDSKQQEGDDDSTPKKTDASKPKKLVDPEKAAKEKERQEKRQARADKEKKEKEAQNKSRNLMASFFGKPKGSLTSASASGSRSNSIPQDAPESGQADKKDGLAPQQSDFERVFKPFLLKKGAELAPQNWFREQVRGRVGKARRPAMERAEGKNVIIIDDDEPVPGADVQMYDSRGEDEDVQMTDGTISASEDVHRGQRTAEERLRESLKSIHKVIRPPNLRYPPRRHRTLKSYHRQTVRGIVQDLTEAEVAGDEGDVRSLLSRLRDRSSIPAKVLIFHEDARPGYFGTWTRNSREVGPRTPFARDVVSLDYGVDSGEEWEEEEEGDVLGNDDDEEGDGAVTEDVDSDLESWLVDDDEVEDPGTPIDDRPGSPDFLPPLPQPKRKAKEADPVDSKKDAKKRKVVVPLVPFIKGPCWESTIGECTYEPFNTYRIQLFNDTPCPIDPFTFVSAPVNEPPLKAQPAQTNSGFAVPSLPARLSNPAISSTLAPPAPTSLGLSQPKRAGPPPKTSFPVAHMPLLIAKVQELDTGNLAFIVESIHKEISGLSKTMGAPSVKKNAIEAKVKEIGEKGTAGKSKVWVVRPEVKALYGVA